MTDLGFGFGPDGSPLTNMVWSTTASVPPPSPEDIAAFEAMYRGLRVTHDDNVVVVARGGDGGARGVRGLFVTSDNRYVGVSIDMSDPAAMVFAEGEQDQFQATSWSSAPCGMIDPNGGPSDGAARRGGHRS